MPHVISRARVRPLVAVLLGLTAASPEAIAAVPPTIIAKNQNVVVFQASASASTRDQLFALLDDSVNTVVLNSAGGDPLAAIDIGREIRRRNLKVGVLGVCAASCAQFIFVAAKQRQVSPESLVVFQNSATSALKLIGDEKIPAAVRDGLAVQAKAEKVFYDEIGMTDALLLEPDAQMLTVCYRYKNPPEGNDRDFERASRFLGWTPTKEYMEAVGVKFEGFWPTLSTMEDATKAYRKLFTPNFKWRALGAPKPAARDALETAYKNAGHVCTAEELKAP